LGEAEIEANLRRIAEVRAKATAVLDGLSDEQMNWHPAPGRWSVGECVLHMVETNEGYEKTLERKIRDLESRGRRARGPLRYGWFSRWFVGLVEPPVRRRLPAPRRFRPPARPAGIDDVRALRASVDRLEAMNRAADGLDLRPKIPSPATKLVRLEVGMALKLLGAHTLRHLLQAEAVTREAGFPRGERT